MRQSLPHFLCDTWWFALTNRFSETVFRNLAYKRKKQGFTAIQLVVGIPPEVGPLHQSASSVVGAPWNLDKTINKVYLAFAAKRITFLNSLGFTVIIYGAWGYQIDWMGEGFMKQWWEEIVKQVDSLDVIYCLTGESDLWLTSPGRLLPDKDTNTLAEPAIKAVVGTRLVNIAKKIYKPGSAFLENESIKRRRKAWATVLAYLSSITQKPILIHTVPKVSSEDAVENSQLLSAVTTQSSHDYQNRSFLWQFPLSYKNFSGPVINLEPWYEGIGNKFYLEDQLFALWSSLMAGAHGVCYGAHGVWNGGDGTFLSHWGKQTLKQATESKTPGLLAASYNLFLRLEGFDSSLHSVHNQGDFLVSISRKKQDSTIIEYISDMKAYNKLFIDAKKTGYNSIFLPKLGSFVSDLPVSGQVVLLRLPH